MCLLISAPGYTHYAAGAWWKWEAKTSDGLPQPSAKYGPTSTHKHLRKRSNSRPIYYDLGSRRSLRYTMVYSKFN